MKNLLTALALALAVSACSKPAETPATPAPEAPAAPAVPPPPPVPVATVDPVTEAGTVFSTRCATCHGATGMGDTTVAQAMNPKPRNYADAEWQKSVTDEYLAKVIVEGGAAVGKSPLMAANADLKDKPEVVKALVAKVRSFAPTAAGDAAAPAAPATAAK